MEPEPNDSFLSAAGYVATLVGLVAATIAIRIWLPDLIVPVVLAFFAGIFFTLFSFRISEGYWPLNRPIHSEESGQNPEQAAERQPRRR